MVAEIATLWLICVSVNLWLVIVSLSVVGKFVSLSMADDICIVCYGHF